MPLEERQSRQNRQTGDFECLDFDDILPHIGGFGKYQKLLVLCILPFTFFLAFNYLSQIFMTLVPLDHWCYVPELSALPAQQQRELSIPLKKNGDNEEYNHCAMYDVNYTHILHTKTKVNESWPQIPCRNGWTYDKEEVPYQTIATEFNWVCHDDGLPALTVSIYFLGSILGGICFGFIADRFGRIPALLLSNLCALVGGVLTAFGNDFVQFSAARFIVGMSYDTSFTSMYILLLEYVGPEYRTLIANFAFAIYYTPAACLLPFIAYYSPDWRYFTLFISAPIIIVFPMYFILPESARWLLSTGRIDKAITAMRHAAKINGKTIPENILDDFEKCCKMYYDQHQYEHVTVVSLLKKRRLAFIMAILVGSWMTITVLYDVHVRAIIDMGPDIFVTFALANLTELPAGIILLLILDRSGRRCTSMTIFLACALCSFSSAIFMIKWKVALAATMGRLFANISYNLGLQWAAEILPTVVRMQGVAFIHIMGYASTVASPLIVYLEHFSHMMPMKILTVLSLLGAILALLLPETLNTVLPQTVEEAEEFGKNQRIFSSPCHLRA